MGDYDYFRGDEPLDYQFYTIPKRLILDPEFKGISLGSKVLYGMLLDRTMLSLKNHWLGEENRVYIIYPIDEICTDLNVTKPTSIKFLTELKEIGLIEAKRQGRGSPSIIYVKKFKSLTSPNLSTALSTKLSTTEAKKSKNFTSRSKKNLPQEVKNFYPNDTDNNKTDLRDTDPPSYHPVDGTIPEEESPSPPGRSDGWLRELKRNIDYSSCCEVYGQERTDELIEFLGNAVKTKSEVLTINGERIPVEQAKAQFLKLTFLHIGYCFDVLAEAKEIRNLRGYVLTVLYNAPAMMNLYYDRKVRGDYERQTDGGGTGVLPERSEKTQGYG